MTFSRRLRSLDDVPGANLIDVVDLSLEALDTQLAVLHHECADGGDKRLPSAWLATLLRQHVDALRFALDTYRAARRWEEDERLF